FSARPCSERPTRERAHTQRRASAVAASLRLPAELVLGDLPQAVLRSRALRSTPSSAQQLSTPSCAPFLEGPDQRRPNRATERAGTIAKASEIPPVAIVP